MGGFNRDATAHNGLVHFYNNQANTIVRDWNDGFFMHRSNVTAFADPSYAASAIAMYAPTSWKYPQANKFYPTGGAKQLHLRAFSNANGGVINNLTVMGICGGWVPNANPNTNDDDAKNGPSHSFTVADAFPLAIFDEITTAVAKTADTDPINGSSLTSTTLYEANTVAVQATSGTTTVGNVSVFSGDGDAWPSTILIDTFGAPYVYVWIPSPTTSTRVDIALRRMGQ